jgi:hypothetical protein
MITASLRARATLALRMPMRALRSLHGFRADTGEALFTGPHQPMTGLRHLQTLIATDDRLYVAADGNIYAFRF